MDIELRNDRIPRNPFDRQFLDMSSVGSNSRSKDEDVNNFQISHDEKICLAAWVRKLVHEQRRHMQV